MAYRIEESLSLSDYDQRRKSPLKIFVMSRYGGLFFMALFTASLLLMPLLLPPLPPPPLMLLFVPVAIMAVLIFLAFTPPQPPNVAFNSM